jgi:LemA protein
VGNFDGSTVMWLLVPIYVGVPVWWLVRGILRFGIDQAELKSALSDLDVALLRKHDLVKKLAEAAKPHTLQERSLVSDLTQYHERAMATRWNVANHSRDEATLDSAVEAVYTAIDKAHLNGDGRFLRDLRREFSASENHIDVASRAYNSRVDRYNTRLTTFPYSFLGKKVLHLRPADAYKAPPEVVVAMPMLQTMRKETGERLS